MTRTFEVQMFKVQSFKRAGRIRRCNPMRRIALLAAATAVTLGVAPLVAMTPATAAGKGEFAAECSLSHRLQDDSLVHPNMAGMSHWHDFFGNTSTNAASNAFTLYVAPTNCAPRADRSAYWVPTLYAGGRAIKPAKVTVYYATDHDDPTRVQPFPFGLAMIVGNAKATGPTSGRSYDWSCRSTVDNQDTIPACPAGSPLELLIHFPDCWNGRTLDSADHKSHMAFTRSGQCPSTHPVRVPRLEYKIVYPVPTAVRAALSSGNGYTAHADFVNAWNPVSLRARVLNCLRPLVKCGTASHPT